MVAAEKLRTDDLPVIDRVVLQNEGIFIPHFFHKAGLVVLKYELSSLLYKLFKQHPKRLL